MFGRLSILLIVIASFSFFLQAQQAAPGPGIVQPAATASSRTLSFSGSVAGQPDGALPVTFFIYADQQSASPLWSETQTVQITGEKYSAMLGSENPSGIPAELFSADSARWLGVEVNGREQRFLLVSVPYAMKAVDADRFGGLLPSQYVTAQQLRAVLGNTPEKLPPANAPTGGNTPRPLAAAAGTPPQPATDFTDNNTSEVLLVTQQGTGFAIHAISSGDAALFAENSSLTGTGVRGSATATTGPTTGVLGQAASPTGTAGAFESSNGAKVLSLRANGNEIGSVDQFGTLTITSVQASNFSGGGFGLANIPPSAVGATPNSVANAIVERDSFGNFFANQVNAFSFNGNGFGLANIPPSAVGATPNSTPNTIVSRDASGNFFANQVNAFSFSGNGFGLSNIPPSAVGATANSTPNTIVARDNSGSFFANQVNAFSFSGNGFGLFNIPNFATTATDQNVPGAIVARDFGGNFFANQVNAFNFTGNGFGLLNIPNAATTAQTGNTPNAIVSRDANGAFSAGLITANGLVNNGVTDFTAASSTLPVKSVPAINTPSTCQAKRELLVKTDVTPGQQLFICNATGNGWVLVGDGNSSSVTTVGAGDSSITVGGTTLTPTISVTNGGITASKLAAGAVSGSIADGSLTPAKIAGTAAILGPNTFSGNQIVQGSIASASVSTGPVSATSATISGSPSVNLVTISQSGTGSALSVTDNGLSTVPAVVITGNEGDAIDARTTFGIGLAASSTNATGIVGTGNSIGIQGNGLTALFANGTSTGVSANASAASGIALTMTTGTTGKFLSGSSSAGQPVFTETFNVSNTGDIYTVGSVSGRFPNNAAGTSGNLLARLDNAGGVQRASINDTTGIVGVVIGGSGNSGNAQIAYSGVANCTFDSAVTAGNYVVNSSVNNGFCRDGGSAFPASGQTVGRSLRSGTAGSTLPIFLFGTEVRGQAGVLSFSQITGTAGTTQLPSTVVYNNQSNTFTGDQTISGPLTVSSVAVQGAMNAATLAGDGTAVFNVNAVKLQGFTPSDFLNDINAETLARQAADASLGSDLNNQINNLSAAAARIGTSNTFTAGTQDFSGAGATLPVRAVTLATTPSLCVASKELLIKTDAPAGQQLFLCNATGSGWNLVGDGASGGVTAFNGRNGSVSPNQGDYSFSQLSGSVAASQMPALTGDVTSSAGSATTTLAATGVTAGTYTKMTVDAKGRATGGSQAAFADLSGSASGAQLPATVVYNNQANTFTGNQSVTGTVTATSFSGNGASVTNVNAATLNGLASAAFAQLSSANTFTGAITAPGFSGNGAGVTNVNAAALNGLASSAFAQLSASNTFSAKQSLAASTTSAASLNVPAGVAPTTPAAGDVWNTGTVLQYRDTASATRSVVSTPQASGMQLLKLTASITPASVSAGACAEQTFTVSGLATTDLVLTTAQPSTSSPGTNIAIGGWRVSAANTIAIQFCNVNRNTSGTPVAGTYTVAIMR